MEAQSGSHGGIQYNNVLQAWREQVAKAAKDPNLGQRLSNRESELLPRFAAQYTKLLALPRHARRVMQRQWKQSLASVALLLALGQTPAMAATINVGGGCSLVNAITAANNNVATGGCTAGGGADTLVLSGDVTLTAVNNYYIGDNGLPVITSDITIQGNGATIERASSAPEFRIFLVDTGAKLTLQQTTISGGKSDSGGGVFNRGATLTLTSCIMSGNTGTGGGAIYNDSDGTLTVNNSTISGNSAPANINDFPGNGGGIFGGGRINITNSTISGNSATGSGSLGGGLQVGGATTLTNSTVSGNSSASDGGGVFNSGDLAVTNSTITRNSASGSGGGMYDVIGSLTLEKALISGNSASNTPEVYRNNEAGGSFTANNFNVFGFSGNSGVSGFSPGATDIVPSVPLAQVLNTTLANNGGPTRTQDACPGLRQSCGRYQSG